MFAAFLYHADEKLQDGFNEARVRASGLFFSDDEMFASPLAHARFVEFLVFDCAVSFLKMHRLFKRGIDNIVQIHVLESVSADACFERMIFL